MMKPTWPVLAAPLILAAGMAAAESDLDAMVAAAKAEPPTTVYAVTGKIVDTAAAFNAKYGLNVTGKKVNEAGQVDLLIRENQAGGVTGSVSLAADAAVIAAELIPRGVVESWAPADIALPDGARDPLVVVSDPHVWAYNAEAYDHCPVTNIWQLTEPDWNRRVALMDPLDKPAYADWFNQLARHHDAEIAAAYEAYHGEPFDASNGGATEAWVRAFAGNGPLVADSSGVADAIGAPGQEHPFFGMLSTAKFRDNADKGYKLAICGGMAPFSGWLYPGLGVIASGTPAPNTAKLFLHYLLTAEGIAAQSVDGKVPSDPAIGLPVEEASGIGGHLGEMMTWNLGDSGSDLDSRQDWQDLWRSSLSR
jgi:iron(III) transport system substrate-binding protein